MANEHTNRVAWGLAAILAAGVLGGGCRLFWPWLKAYRVAVRHHKGIDLHSLHGKEADLQAANLADADLSTAKLADAILTRARYHARTRWPRGFEPKRYGAVRVETAQ